MKRKLILIGLFVAAVVLGVIYRETVLGAVGQYLVSDGALEKSDAIIVLNGGVPERMLEAVDLFKAGYAPRLILARVEEPENQSLLKRLGITVPEEHEVNQQIAAKLGVPLPAIIMLEHRANSTYSEMEVIGTYCLEQKFNSVILVTSKPHTTRAYKLFQLLTDGRVQAIPRPSRYDTFDPHGWWRDRQMSKEVWFEYQKLANYYLVEQWK
jgi:uncharacterized SAM-binding protein YcdF (DUF218 family)